MNTSTQAATQQQAHTFDPIVNHDVRKADITRSIVTGEPLTALCGEQWTIDSTEDAYTGPSVDCPLCAVVYGEMPTRRQAA